MTPKKLLRKVLGKVDRTIVSRLSADTQISVKRAVLRVVSAVSPGSFPSWIPDGYLIRPPPEMIRETSLPPWARAELLQLAREIDAAVHPSALFARGVDVYTVPFARARAGDAYFRIRSAIHGPVDALVIVPWLKQGGADRGAILYAKALSESGARVLVLSTEPHDSPWLNRLPDGVQFVDCGPALSRLHYDGHDAERVIARLVVQLAPERTFLFGSRVGWDAVRLFGRAIRARTELHVSLFCDEPDSEGVPRGYAESHLVPCAPWIQRVLVDHNQVVDEWTLRHALPEALFAVVPFPAPRVVPRSAVECGRRVLWASRLDRQKRPDLLAKIAERMPEFHWDVHGIGVVPGEEGSVEDLRRLPNVTLHGEFSDFAAIVRPEHFAFVYTSAWDGLPTVLLDAAAHQLPIIAPRLGGIPELLVDEQMIAKADDVDAYVERLHVLYGDVGIRQKLVATQMEAIASRTWERFASGI